MITQFQLIDYLNHGLIDRCSPNMCHPVMSGTR